MNDVSKLYQLVINKELAQFKNDLLDTNRIKQKLLSFIQNISQLGEQAHVYTFWDSDHSINHQELLDTYIEGMTMIMSIGYEMRMDEIKMYEEIPADISLDNLMFKLYEDIIIYKNTFNAIAYQNILDDYFVLGFKLHITIDEIIDNLY